MYVWVHFSFVLQSRKEKVNPVSSAAYYILFASHRVSDKSVCSSNPMPTAAESVMQMFIMSLGNFGDIYPSLECTDHEVTGKVRRKAEGDAD